MDRDAVAERVAHAVSLLQARRFEEAERECSEVLIQDPVSLPALQAMAAALVGMGQLAAGAEWLSRAGVLHPRSVDAHVDLGRILNELRRFDGAIEAFHRALALRPTDASTFVELSVTLRRAGKLDDAVAAATNAIGLRQDQPDAYAALGSASRRKRQLSVAIAALRRAVELEPTRGSSWAQLAEALADFGEQEEASRCFAEAARLRHEDWYAHSNYLYSLLHLASASPCLLLDEHRKWGARHSLTEPDRETVLSNDRSWSRRLRLGYVSTDFREHAAAAFMVPLLAAHDRTAFEVYCYSNTPHSDSLTRRFKSLADHWRDVARLDDLDMRRLIAGDQIDLLVNLDGHIGKHRTRVFTHRVAPVQCSYLSYPCTVGVNPIDVRITDSHVDPPGEDDAYVERLTRLDRSMFCYAASPGLPEITPLPLIAKGHVTFGAFNRLIKVTPAAMTAWGEILRSTPRSRLSLLVPMLNDSRSDDLLRERLSKYSVPIDRVDFVRRDARTNYLRRLGEVDLCLDTFPYNGQTTTCDALSMGVPTVSLSGGRAASRVGDSILNEVGLKAFVTTTRDNYVACASGWARRVEELDELRRTLRPRLESSRLGDGVNLARSLESAYRALWSEWCRDGTLDGKP